MKEFIKNFLEFKEWLFELKDQVDNYDLPEYYLGYPDSILNEIVKKFKELKLDTCF